MGTINDASNLVPAYILQDSMELRLRGDLGFLNDFQGERRLRVRGLSLGLRSPEVFESFDRCLIFRRMKKR